MKHFGFTALEFIAWARICRPGCVLGPQQQFLVDLQEICWRWGENFRNGVPDSEESKEIPESINLSAADKFKAKFGDYKQAEKLAIGVNNHEGHDKGLKTINSSSRTKIVKKVAFNKNK